MAWFAAILKELKTDIPIATAIHLIIDEVKDAFAKNVHHTLETNPRRDVMRVIASMPKPTGDILLNRLRVAGEAAVPAHENDVVVALGELCQFADNKLNVDETKALFEWVAALPDEHFAVFVDAMMHDPYMQRLRMAWRKARLGEKLDQTGELVDDLLATWTASAVRRGKV